MSPTKKNIDINTIYNQLISILEARKIASTDQSYIATLYQRGLNTILKKVGEESTEFVLAAKDFEKLGLAETQNELIHESADLWFHSLVALVHLNISPDQVWQELEKRFSQSGLEEKASRRHK
ncbi:MAG: phosphoribosyl-ATP diphosphatase [Pseudomonadota bacterium]